ncbi:hypothetical protein KS4_31700 [Poriferisphaera corsica]|uniref:Cell division protein n=1 Tax=Poriferisphaera corsica TaxID=2528020 RepID=A0A517YXY4_9BACT|nr:SRPBCC family protein [Poriferisphaera corsica]QDU35092.1 hypothetical protein KS4_31700 [Poriferisphaera corsica]
MNIQTVISAPIETCFELACNVDFHKSLDTNSERIIGGKTSGMLQIDDQITWESTHFGIKQKFVSKITALTSPTHLQDVMVEGAFKSYTHDHYFEKIDDIHTRMNDIIQYEVPMWAIGRLMEIGFMNKYLHNLIESRCNAIKEKAEQIARKQ